MLYNVLTALFYSWRYGGDSHEIIQKRKQSEFWERLPRERRAEHR